MQTRLPLRVLGLIVAALLAVSGCSLRPAPGADEAIAKLIAGLEAGSLKDIAFTGDSSAIEDEYQLITAGLDGAKPTLSAQDVTYPANDQAQVKLDTKYSFDSADWVFSVTANLRFDQGWKIIWDPNLLHPSLSSNSKLLMTRTQAQRGTIVDREGKAIVEQRQVFQVGIDKANVAADLQEDSARKLAALVDVDADSFVEQVKASGPQGFVVAITLRAGQVPGTIGEIPGAIAYESQLPLAPSATFASGLMGTVGAATAEEIANSDGKILEGDLVGKSGVQLDNDDFLRGSPGVVISLVARDDTQPEASALPGDASPASVEPAVNLPQDLFSVGAVDGQSLKLTLDLDRQMKLDQAMAAMDGLFTAVVLDKDGGLVAASTSPAGQNQPLAVTGLYPPGSTMKVISSLALLRRGMNPDSIVQCSPTASVNGYQFGNYPGYPQAMTGDIALRDALAQSCNTAFVNADLSDDELSSAGASLGFGVDYQSGFGAIYGQIPASDDEVVRRANSFGQGHVLATAVSLASVSASVLNQKTSPAYIVADSKLEVEAELSAEEASQLASMMQGVLAGTGSFYAPWLNGLKTGTAEFAREDGSLGSHIWVTGFTGDKAIAIMGFDNASVSQFAPILDAALR